MSWFTPDSTRKQHISVEDVTDFIREPVVDPTVLHPLANIGSGLDYLALEDDALNSLPGSHTALPSRGWGDDLCYGTGTTYLAALSVGGAWGAIEALRNKNNRNSSPKLQLNALLNGVTRRGPFLGNSAGVIALVYNGINSAVGHLRGCHDHYNSIAAGALSGALFKSTGIVNGLFLKLMEAGVRQAAVASAITTFIAASWCWVKTHL